MTRQFERATEDIMRRLPLRCSLLTLLTGGSARAQQLEPKPGATPAVPLTLTRSSVPPDGDRPAPDWLVYEEGATDVKTGVANPR